MKHSTRNLTLLVAALAVALGAVAAALWLGRAVEPAVLEAAPEPGSLPRAPVETRAERVELVQGSAAPAGDPGPTTVVFPLEVELELVEGRPPIELDGELLAPGVAGTARLRGNVWNERGEGAAAEVRFEHGPNEGRVLFCDASGAFGANDLLPGLSIVRIEGAGLVGSQRELLLRQQRETRLDVSYARPGSVQGLVVDAEGNPLAGARVSVDGQEGTTDAEGRVRFPRVASGEVLVVVEHAGSRSLRETLGVTAAHTVPPERTRWILRPGAALTVHVPERVGAEGEALLFVLPPRDSTRDFPWHLVNPVRVWPGGSATVEGLPEGRLDLRLFHAGARARPELAVASLSPGHLTPLELHLEPAPMLVGRVLQAGAPVARARVTLELSDVLAATLSALGVDYSFVESEVLPLLPPARQTTATDAKGEFALTAYAELGGQRWLSAVGPDKRSVALRPLKAEESEVELVLVPSAELSPRASLRLRLGERWQPLPVRVRVDGAPRDPFVLAAGRDLVIGELVPGRWSLSARWDVERIAEARELVLDDELALDLALPQGAIDGQTAEIRRRAGR